VLPQHSEGWRLLDVTHATVRAAFPRKFFRKRTLAAAALSGYAWREGACGGKTWFSGPKPWAAARRLPLKALAQCPPHFPSLSHSSSHQTSRGAP